MHPPDNSGLITLNREIRRAKLEHDPEKWVPVLPRDKREAFARRSCSNKKMERNDYSKKSHSALIVRCRAAPARQIDRVLAFRQSQRFLGRLFEIGFHALA